VAHSGFPRHHAAEDHTQASLGTRTSAARSNGSAPSPDQEHQCHDRVEARDDAIRNPGEELPTPRRQSTHAEVTRTSDSIPRRAWNTCRAGELPTDEIHDGGHSLWLSLLSTFFSLCSSWWRLRVRELDGRGGEKVDEGVYSGRGKVVRDLKIFLLLRSDSPARTLR
jgi:hypothetical protein